MNLFDKYNCILCKYNKYNKGNDSCFNHREKDKYGYPVGECKFGELKVMMTCLVQMLVYIQ